MIIDFSHSYYPEKPVLVLQDVDDTPIQTLGYAFGITCNLCFNEISTLEFDLPAYVDGVKTPHYDDVIGLRVVDLVGWGVFILMQPTTSLSGVKEIKHCVAYSREYELAGKKIALEENVYQFWNPIEPQNTLLAMLMEKLPSWHVGYVSEKLVTKWCYLQINYTDIYAAIKNDIQQKYQCVFQFDTYTRTINVYSIHDDILTSGVFLSTQNLLKEITLTEDTEHIVTALDVNGAEGVNIRAVNPMGINMIYNLDYMIQSGMVPSALAAKLADWKNTYEQNRIPYFQLVTEAMLRQSAILTLQQQIDHRTGTAIAPKENTIAVDLAMMATLSDTTSQAYQELQTEIAELRTEIAGLEEQNAAAQQQIDEAQVSYTAVLEQMRGINHATQWSYEDQGDTIYNFGMTAEDLLVLDRMLKEDSLTESSFMMPAAQSYVSHDLALGDGAFTLNVTTTGIDGSGNECMIGSITGLTSGGTSIYDASPFYIDGGKLHLQSGETSPLVIDAVITRMYIQASEESDEDSPIVQPCQISARLGAGSLTQDGITTPFPGGCLSFVGEWNSLDGDMDSDPDSSLAHGTTLTVEMNGTIYFTRNTTAYERYSVEWDLYEYGADALQKLAWPSYSFQIDAANFLCLEDFQQFANELTLGKRCYLQLGDRGVLEPILVRVKLAFDDPTSLELEFGNTFSLSDSAFSLVDLIEQGVSMGKTLDTSRFSYNAFIDTGASNSVREYMQNALDVSKQSILSGGDMEIQWDHRGMWFRKKRESGTGYDPKQLAIINNQIVFTDDAWASAKMAIGQFSDKNTGNNNWGVIAPSIVGTLFAGEQAIIESTKTDGSVLAFRVDANGASLHNASYSLYEATSTSDHGHIDMGARFGILGGVEGASSSLFHKDNYGNVDGVLTSNGNGVATISALTANEEPEANFWIDMNGDVWLRGKIYAESGTFKGIVQAQDFLDANGQSMLKDGKFVPAYVELGDVYSAIDNLGDSIVLSVSDPSAGGQVSITLTVDGKPAGSGQVTIDGNVDISGSLSAEELYASLGDIADLTVDTLSTSKRIRQYYLEAVVSNPAKKSDDNYIHINDQDCHWNSGHVKYNGTTALTEYATNPNGQRIYWERDITASSVTPGADGWPTYNGSRVMTTTIDTGYPVYVFQYETETKASLSFELDADSGYYIPELRLGDGDQHGQDKAWMIKKVEELDLFYKAKGDKIIGMKASLDGYVDMYGMRRTVALDCSNFPDAGQTGNFVETLEGSGDKLTYKVQVSADAKSMTITYPDGMLLPVTLP